MSEEKLKQIESMLSQLITSVGTIMTEQTAIRKDISEIKEEQKQMRNDITKIQEDQRAMRDDINKLQVDQRAMRDDISKLQVDQKAMRDENQVRHHEIMRRFGRIEADQTYTWKKTVENEREINMLKSKAN